MEEIIVENNLNSLSSAGDGHYLAHILCCCGHCSISFNGNRHTISKGDCAIFRAVHLAHVTEQSKDLEVKVIYVSRECIEKSTPSCNYGMKGSLSLFNAPVMHLNQDEFDRLNEDFDNITKRLYEKQHHFHKELMFNKVQSMILDFFDAHARIYGADPTANSESELVNRFIAMLNAGEFHKNRQVAYYADALCVVPKHLSEACKKVSGYPAIYWINRFTSLEISRLLRDRSLSLTEIADYFCFSSLAYFSRYVQKHLGESPSEYRNSGKV